MTIKGWLILVMMAALAGMLFRVWSFPGDFEKETVPVTLSSQLAAALPKFELTVLQRQGTKQRVIVCRARECEPLPEQKSEGAAAATDGKVWYYYELSRTVTEGKKMQLRRRWVGSNKNDLIIEQTKLVKPRGLYISPDNQKVAFWLDNISRDSNNMTELWVYDATEKGTRVLAEKIRRQGVLTEPRWNRSSTQLFFWGRIDAGGLEGKALHVVGARELGMMTPFTDFGFGRYGKMRTSEVIDVSKDGKALAYAERGSNGTLIYMQSRDMKAVQAKVLGVVPYLQWWVDDTILYVVQHSNTFDIWRLGGDSHRHVARYQGVFQSARADKQNRYLVFNARQINGNDIILALDVDTGEVEIQRSLPRAGGKSYLIHLQLEEKSAVAGAINSVDDEVMVAFIDKHLSDIAQEAARPQRLIITDQTNTLWLDYRAGDGSRHRILLTIKDAVQAEWTVIGRYEEKSGEWVLTRGGALTEPRPVRVYEWETELGRWILKQSD